MATYSKTEGRVLITPTAITHPGSFIGSELDTSTLISGTLICYWANVEDGVADTNPGSFLVQTSGTATNDEDWATLVKFTPTVTTGDTQAVGGAEAAGQTVLSCAATAGFTAGMEIYIQDTTVVADGEWHRIEQIVTDVSIDIHGPGGLVVAKDTADLFCANAQKFVTQLDLSAVARLRVMFEHEGAAGANVHVKALMVTADSIA